MEGQLQAVQRSPLGVRAVRGRGSSRLLLRTRPVRNQTGREGKPGEDEEVVGRRYWQITIFFVIIPNFVKYLVYYCSWDCFHRAAVVVVSTCILVFVVLMPADADAAVGAAIVTATVLYW